MLSGKDFRETAGELGLIGAAALEVDHFWVSTPIEILLSLLLEDD